MTEPALKLENISKSYGAMTAVRDLSFEAPRGRIFGFLGPNGAGKTSTLRMILGLVAPTSGRISVLGASDGRRVRDRIGFLPEERGLYRRMTPAQAFDFFGALKGLDSRTARQRGEAMLVDQGLGQAMHKPVKSLSKGMAQKVALISALVHEPELVILDEPFSGLDPVNQQSLERLIRGLADRGATVVFSTHVMAHAERLCDKVVLMARGRKVFDGPVAAARAAVPQRMILVGDMDPDRVRALPGVTGVTREESADGPSLVVDLAAGASANAALKAAFVQGLEITRFEAREPTLHDAFIVLTRDAPEGQA
jgi:ABC-2 type transport system ATP-binding protein